MKFQTTHLILLSLLLLPTKLGAQNFWYVDGVNGSNSNGGITPNDAFATINYALSFAFSGDTINVLPATYSERVVLNMDGIRLQGLPTAAGDPILQIVPDFTSPRPYVAIEIDGTFTEITSETLIRGFHIIGTPDPEPDIGVWIHDDIQGFDGSEMSPIVELCTFQDCVYGIHYQASVIGGAPLFRFNHIIDTDDLFAQPDAVGITVEAWYFAVVDAVSQANKIEEQEWGHGIYEFFGGTNNTLMRSNMICHCEWGAIVGGSNGSPRITNETIAHGHPASPNQVVKGIESYNPNLLITNSIIWVPDTIDPFGNVVLGVDLINVSAGQIDAFSIVEDNTPSLDPMFVDPVNCDLHLLPGSPAIDAGNNTVVRPTGVDPVAYDCDGDPRILDASRTHNLTVDVGADEYTTVTMDCFDPLAVATSSGRPIINIREGGQLAVTVTGLGGDSWFFYYGPAANVNVLILDLGNVLVPLQFSNSFGQLPGAIGTPSSASTTFSMPPGFGETNWDMQSLLIPPGGFAQPYTGSWTRRVIMEINES